jgi:KaiC domain protein
MSEESDDDWFERAVSDTAAGEAVDDEATDSELTGPGLTDDELTDDGPQPAESHRGDESSAPTREGNLDDAAEKAFAAAEASNDGNEENPSEMDPGEDPFQDSGGSQEAGDGSQFGGGDGGSLFEDDFESAFGAASGPGEEEFDDEEFESEIPRIDLGIEGLDGMIQGGVPERHLIVTIGSAGTGKTTFGLQFLHHGLQQGENAIYITLEQSHEAIMATADEWGWDFDAYEADGQLAVVDLDPVEMANSLDNIRGELPGLIEEFDADRFVLDSVSLLEMMYDRQAQRRTEVFDFTRSLKRAGVTTMLTSEANEDNPYASRHGIIEYLTDAVFILQYVRSETQETRLAVEIQKIRNANHSRESKPYEITMDGISVYQQANIL